MGPVRETYVCQPIVDKLDMSEDEIIEHSHNHIGRYKGPVWTKLPLPDNKFYMIAKDLKGKITHFPKLISEESPSLGQAATILSIRQDPRYAQLILKFKLDQKI